MPPEAKSATPLPPNKYQGSETGKAYNQCLELEKQGELWSTPQEQFAASPYLAARILGYALLFAPCDSGRDRLTSEILACHDDLALKNLADLYIDGLIRVFRSPKGPTPAVSSDQSPLLSFEQGIANMGYLLEKPSINHRELRKLVMVRDNYRCVFTGALDFSQYEKDPASSEESTDTLELAHIISQSMSDNTKGNSDASGKKANWANTAGALLEFFGGFSLRDTLGDKNVQSPLNAFMASGQAHRLFDSLKLWLVPAQDRDNKLLPDTYDVKSTVVREDFHRVGRGLKSQVTFKARQVDEKTIPPPDNRIMAVHAACAQIVNMSGAAEYLDKSLRAQAGEIPARSRSGSVYKLAQASTSRTSLILTTD